MAALQGPGWHCLLVVAGVMAAPWLSQGAVSPKAGAMVTVMVMEMVTMVMVMEMKRAPC